MKYHSTLFDSLLTDEQKEKRSIVEEAMDRRGWIVRYRVNDQTIFDVMFIQDHIDRPQHEAGHCFLTVIEKSGAYPASCSLEPSSGAPVYQVGNLIGERRMAFGSAYRFMQRECGDDDASYLMSLMSNVFKTSDDRFKGSRLKRIAKAITSPLNSLSRFYRTEDKQDPRVVIRQKLKRGTR